MRRWPLALALALVLMGWSAPAGAQDGAEDPPREVRVGFDLGEYVDGDWTVDAVVVEGDLDAGQDVTVQILGRGGRVLWEGMLPFSEPALRIPVDGRVLVGDVESAGISQALTLDALLVEPDIREPVAGGGGGSGQIATSMVLVIIIAVILFRTPLPSASSQRWTR